ncbi:MAG TPA: septum site-determining protein Ssd [Nocardioidaceae bacterium]|nr:septum site-determining protein Ssd [Nocardioidaceae bacterium]
MSHQRPLIVTGDEALLDVLLRLTAAAGVTPEVVHDPGLVRRAWAAAPLVVLGQDLAASIDATVLGRRDAVYAVVTNPDDIAVWESAVAAGAEKVLVLPEAEAWLRDRFADTADGGPTRALTIAVLGGCGGAGASTLAATLGATAARGGSQALCVDADPLGGGIDLALGSEHVPGARWPDLLATTGRVSAPSLRQALPAHAGLSVLSWDRDDLLVLPPEVMGGVLAAGRRGGDLVVVDLPRRLDGSGHEVLLASDLVLLVVPAEVRAVAAASRVLRQLSGMEGRIELVVRGPGPAGLHGALVADNLDVPLAADMRSDRGLAADIDLGRGPWGRTRGPLVRACRSILDRHLGRVETAA